MQCKYAGLPLNSTDTGKLKGQTWRMGNETEIRKSICAIVGCLESLPAFVNGVIGDCKSKNVTNNTKVFLKRFNLAVAQTDFAGAPQQQCSTNLSALDTYNKKTTIYGILKISMIWVKNFTQMEPSC